MSKYQKGENRQKTKLTNQQVLEIFNSNMSNKHLAEKYKTSKHNISSIKLGVTWASITGKEYIQQIFIDKNRTNTCQSCSIIFKGKSKNAKYCSMKCMQEYLKNTDFFRKRLCKKILPEKIVCEGCKREFVPPKGKSKYCSRYCFGSHSTPHANFLEASKKIDRKKLGTLIMSKNWKNNRERMRAVNKGKIRSEETKDKLSEITKKQWESGQFDEDVNGRRKNLKKGKDHFNYKNGAGSIREKLHSLFQYKEWRNSVFIRDDYTCQGCGVRGGYLEAHHIVPFREIQKRHGFTNHVEAAKCDELFDVNNGTTLCKECHGEVDEHRKRTLKKVA